MPDRRHDGEGRGGEHALDNRLAPARQDAKRRQCRKKLHLVETHKMGDAQIGL